MVRKRKTEKKAGNKGGGGEFTFNKQWYIIFRVNALAKPKDKPTQNSPDINSNESIYELIM